MRDVFRSRVMSNFSHGVIVNILTQILLVFPSELLFILLWIGILAILILFIQMKLLIIIFIVA